MTFRRRSLFSIVCFIVLVGCGCSKAEAHCKGHFLALPHQSWLGGGEPSDKSLVNFEPELFHAAPFHLHSFLSFSADGRQMFWSVVPPRILFSQLLDNGWSEPEPVPFSRGNGQSPFLTKDGKRLYFQMTDPGGFGGLDIWYVEKTESGWSEPQNVGCPPNSAQLEGQTSLTVSGTIYFTASMSGVAWERGIYSCRLLDGAYLPPSALPESINSTYIDAYPYISPDERFLLFSSSRPTMDESRLSLFVSFYAKGQWSNPVNVSKHLGLDAPARYGSISPDGRYLFFLYKESYYCVSARVLDVLDPNSRGKP